MLLTTLPPALAATLAASAWVLLALTGVGSAPAAAVAVAEGSAWQLPLGGQPQVARPFAPPPQPWLPGHRGVDLRARDGVVVTAAGAGRVTYAGTLAGRGVVVVDHGDLRTTYEPLVPAVSVGQRVARGRPIGRLAAAGSHCGPTPCLHWGLRRGPVYLDPMSLLVGPVRLLPLGAGPGFLAEPDVLAASAPAAAVRRAPPPAANDRGPPPALGVAAAGGLAAAALALTVSRR